MYYVLNLDLNPWPPVGRPGSAARTDLMRRVVLESTAQRSSCWIGPEQLPCPPGFRPMMRSSPRIAAAFPPNFGPAEAQQQPSSESSSSSSSGGGGGGGGVTNENRPIEVSPLMRIAPGHAGGDLLNNPGRINQQAAADPGDDRARAARRPAIAIA
eukprot:SAG31_NODE_5697_length_2374_cov_3.198681_1_plen_156_part_00